MYNNCANAPLEYPIVLPHTKHSRGKPERTSRRTPWTCAQWSVCPAVDAGTSNVSITVCSAGVVGISVLAVREQRTMWCLRGKVRTAGVCGRYPGVSGTEHPDALTSRASLGRAACRTAVMGARPSVTAASTAVIPRMLGASGSAPSRSSNSTEDLDLHSRRRTQPTRSLQLTLCVSARLARVRAHFNTPTWATCLVTYNE